MHPKILGSQKKSPWLSQQVAEPQTTPPPKKNKYTKEKKTPRDYHTSTMSRAAVFLLNFLDVAVGKSESFNN